MASHRSASFTLAQYSQSDDVSPSNRRRTGTLMTEWFPVVASILLALLILTMAYQLID